MFERARRDINIQQQAGLSLAGFVPEELLYLLDGRTVLLSILFDAPQWCALDADSSI
jgi:hypothetical protein